jgi:SAM-dependent methyltransferase
MSGFSRDWLALREPFDRAARAAGDAALAAWRPAGPLHVLDLGCGTGASLRALAPRLGGTQHWHLVDHDRALLDALPGLLADWAAHEGLRLRATPGLLQLEGPQLRVDIVRTQADLATQLHRLPFAGTTLVTASALLDLVSEPWLAALVGHCRTARAAVCWALDVDGRIEWSPSDAGDAQVQAWFGAHQRGDKGFGPALGPTATVRATALLRAAGYRTQVQASDWLVEAGRSARDDAMVQALLEGMALAATEQAPGAAATVQAWRMRRSALQAGSRLRVGHADLLAWPAA